MREFPHWVVVLVVVLLLGWRMVAPGVDSAPVRALVAAGAPLVDVRTPEEFAARHLDGAVNIPVGEIAGRANEIGPMDRPVVVYCRSGARSAAAARTLRGLGFTSVTDLGAMSNW